MLLARSPEGVINQATPHAAGHTCPLCTAPVIAKCGTIVTPHWAHIAAEDCDPWSEPETEWHLGWKRRFAQAGADVEVTMNRDGTAHRADVVVGPWVIELQHSALSITEAHLREEFYGPRMIWLWDMTDAARWDNMRFGERGFWWPHGSKMQVQLRRPLWWHIPGSPDLVLVKLSTVMTDTGSRRVLGWVRDNTTAEQLVLDTTDRVGLRRIFGRVPDTSGTEQLALDITDRIEVEQ